MTFTWPIDDGPFGAVYHDFWEWYHHIGSAWRMLPIEELQKRHKQHVEYHNKNERTINMIWRKMRTNLEAKMEDDGFGAWSLKCTRQEVADEIIRRLKRWVGAIQ